MGDAGTWARQGNLVDEGPGASLWPHMGSESPGGRRRDLEEVRCAVPAGTGGPEMRSESRRRKPEAVSGGPGCRGWTGTDGTSGRSPWARLAGRLPGTSVLSSSGLTSLALPLLSLSALLSRSVPPRPCGDVLSPPAGVHARVPQLRVLLKGPCHGPRRPMPTGLQDVPELLDLTPKGRPKLYPNHE